MILLGGVLHARSPQTDASERSDEAASDVSDGTF